MARNNEVNQAPAGARSPYAGQGRAMGGPSFKPADLDLDTILQGITFPVTHGGLLGTLNPDAIDAAAWQRLEAMPEATYQDMEQFRQAFGEEYDNYGGVESDDKTMDWDLQEFPEPGIEEDLSAGKKPLT